MTSQRETADARAGSRNFGLFWASETLTTLTATVSGLAVPLVAVVTLHASAFQVGILAASGQLAFALTALPAGVIADRTRHRPAMIVSNLARAIVVCTVPVAAIGGVLHLWMLYAVEVALAVLRSFYEPAWHAYLPTLVGRDRLLTSNSRLLATTTATDLGGKGLGGLLIQVVGAPLAIAVNAVAFTLSALALASIHHDEPRPDRGPTTLRNEMAGGLRQVWGHPMLRSLSIFLVGAAAGLSAYYALSTVFLARTVGLPAGAIGWVFAGGGVGGVAGGLMTPRLADRLGSSRLLRICTAVTFPFGLLIPLTGPGWRVIAYIAGAGTVAAGIAAYNVLSSSLTQTICRPELLGRVFSVIRLIVLAASTVGSTVGGLLGTRFGPRTALLVIMAALLAIPTSLLLASPLRQETPPAPTVTGPRG